jgi:hypothetical protein
MSNETRNDTNATSRLAAPDAKDQTAVEPAVAITADLPIPPQFRDRTEAINWRAALSKAGLAAFLAAVAGIGCGAKVPIRKPSPAVPIAGSSTTLSASAARNLGPVTR